MLKAVRPACGRWRFRFETRSASTGLSAAARTRLSASSTERRAFASAIGPPRSEGRISTLKRGYGWDRSRIDGTEGTRIWTGHGVLTHNLVKISALAA